MSYMDKHDLKVFLVSDSGRDCAGLVEAFSPRRIFSTGIGLGGRSCAIILDADLTLCGEVQEDPSGGAISVDVRLVDGKGHPVVVRLIAVYQPPGLDDVATVAWCPTPTVGALSEVKTGTLRGPVLRAEAHRVRAVVGTWSRAAGIDMSILGGDLNETVVGMSDRSVGPSCTRGGSQTFGCIHHMIISDGWSDSYRDTHPVPDDVEGCIDVEGHTYRGSDITGSSRLTYVMVHPQPSAATVQRTRCHVDESLFLGGPGGHRPLVWAVPCGLAGTLDKGTLPFLGASIRTAGLSGERAETLRLSIEQAMGARAARWVGLLDSIAVGPESSVGDQRAAQALAGSVVEEFTQCLVSSCSGITSARRAGPGKRHRPPPRLSRATSIRRQLVRLKRALSLSLPPCCESGAEPPDVFSHEAALARHELRRWDAESLLGSCATARWSNVPVWRALLDRFKSVLDVVRSEIKAAIASDPGHPANLKRTLLRSAKGRGRYYARVAKGAVGGVVSSARNGLGEVQTRPEVYKPIVRAKVAAPFSNPRSGPAVPVWRSLSTEEKTTGVPFWWSSMYSWNAKGIDGSVWGSLLESVDPRAIYDIIASTDGGKSPGHDGVTMDLLKLAIGLFPGSGRVFERCALLDVLVALVNLTVRTGVVPLSSTVGEIVLVPKPGSSSTDPSDMRPITLLSELGKLVSRVLAGRLTGVLHTNPDVLDEAQRANLHDGNCRQSLNTVFNMCEDYLERAKSDPDAELFLTSYDVRKAFDSVQGFTLLATCERFGLPKIFASILVSSLSGGVSRVRTAGGLTEPIQILTSVRQGDPLAAIAFVLLMDALHAGFKHNPLAGPSAPVTGYALAGGHGPTVHSCGYADDTLHANTSWAATRLQHMWVLDFFTAHHLRLNSSKSYCVVASGSGVSADVLSVADSCKAAGGAVSRAAGAAEAWSVAADYGDAVSAARAVRLCRQGVAEAKSAAKLAETLAAGNDADDDGGDVDPSQLSVSLTLALREARDASHAVAAAATALGVLLPASVKSGARLDKDVTGPIVSAISTARNRAARAAAASGHLRMRSSELRSLPDIDESRVHDPASGRPAPSHMLSWPFPLLSPDIVTRPRTYAFRYLGFMLRVDLQPTEMVRVLSGRVWSAVRRIQADKMTLLEASDFLREFVYPRMELGLLFGNVTKKTLEGWDSLVARAVLGVHRVSNVSSVAHSALYMALGIPPLSAYSLVVAGTELGVALRDVPEAMHSLTTRSRLHAAISSGHLTTVTRDVGGVRWQVVQGARECRVNRVARVLCRLSKGGTRVSFPAAMPLRRAFSFVKMPPVDVRVGCPLLHTRLSSMYTYTLCPPVPLGCRPVSVFTDGAFRPGHGGYAAFLCLTESVSRPGFVFGPLTCVILQGGSPSSGANYSAEAAAILVSLRSVPVNCSLTLYTDALSAMQSISRGLLQASRRVRLGARAFIVLCRELIAMRLRYGGLTVFIHVHSHTEGLSSAALGNAAADVSAGIAAEAEQYRAERETPFLVGEEDFVFWTTKSSGDYHVSGDLGATLKRLAMSGLLTRLRELPTQGAVAREAGSQLASQFNLVRKARNPDLLLFLLLVSVRQTHTADRLVWPRSARSYAVVVCKRCGRAPQSADHIFVCGAVRGLLRAARAAVTAVALQLARPLFDSQAVSVARKTSVRALCTSADWCDPSVYPRLPVDGAACPVLLSGRLSPYAGLLGLLPPELPRLLCPSPESLGARERVQKDMRAQADAGLDQLRLRTLQASRTVYEGWCLHSVSRPPYKKLTLLPLPTETRPVWDVGRKLWVVSGRVMATPADAPGARVLTSSDFRVRRPQYSRPPGSCTPTPPLVALPPPPLVQCSVPMEWFVSDAGPTVYVGPGSSEPRACKGSGPPRVLQLPCSPPVADSSPVRPPLKPVHVVVPDTPSSTTGLAALALSLLRQYIRRHVHCVATGGTVSGTVAGSWCSVGQGDVASDGETVDDAARELLESKHDGDEPHDEAEDTDWVRQRACDGGCWVRRSVPGGGPDIGSVVE